MSSVEEAIGTIKNLQANLSGPLGWDAASLDVDKYGLRMSGAITTTSSEWVPTYGGAIVGNTYVPMAGGSYQDRSQQNSSMCVIPFKEVNGFVLARPKFVRPTSIWVGTSEPDWYWGYPSRPYRVRMTVGLDDKPAVDVLITDEKSAQQFVDAVATLVIATGHNPFRTMIGTLMSNLTEEQKTDSGVASGVLVWDVSAGSPAEKAGLQYLDIVVKVDGVPVSSVLEFKGALQKAGDSTTLEIHRLEQKPDAQGRMAYVYVPHDIAIPLKASH